MKQKIFLSSLIVIFLISFLVTNVLALNCNELEHSYYGCNPNEECMPNTIWADDTYCNSIDPNQVCCIPKTLEDDPGVKDYIKKLEESQGFIIKNPLGQTSDIYTLIEIITKFLIGLAIVITPIIVVYAGFLYITAGGNEEKVKTAQKVLIWALIGFALVLIARGVPALIKQFLTSNNSNTGSTETCLNSGGNCCNESEICSGQIFGACDNGLICCEGECTVK